MNELAGLIEEALLLRDPREGIARAKRLVRNSLRRAEPRSEVRETEFFDHTFAPDLIILNSGGRPDSERWVYLRTTSDPGGVPTLFDTPLAYAAVVMRSCQARRVSVGVW